MNYPQINRKLDLIVRLLQQRPNLHDNSDRAVLSRIRNFQIGKSKFQDHAIACGLTVPQFRNAIYRLADRGAIVYYVDPGKRQPSRWIETGKSE